MKRPRSTLMLVLLLLLAALAATALAAPTYKVGDTISPAPISQVEVQEAVSFTGGIAFACAEDNMLVSTMRAEYPSAQFVCVDVRTSPYRADVGTMTKMATLALWEWQYYQAWERISLEDGTPIYTALMYHLMREEALGIWYVPDAYLLFYVLIPL